MTIRGVEEHVTRVRERNARTERPKTEVALYSHVTLHYALEKALEKKKQDYGVQYSWDFF